MTDEQIIIDAIETAMLNAAAQLKMGKDKPHSLVEFSIDADGEAVKIRMDITAAKDEVTND